MKKHKGQTFHFNLLFLLNFEDYPSIDTLKKIYEPGRFNNAQVRRKHHGGHDPEMAEKTR
jgi:hypothetical protein